ncbi:MULTISPECIES: MarR family winged helix-turn-helix transcriptional regulator [unclassified Leisingera]|uniref:MarR family winged helix-turn-helix transcriptional regulator n=1 Tax=unclassified Leisingera TaxID=2614906 RepID=UPI001013B51A|nr:MULTISPECIES: MarR family winged helix-turn-helix transcriptional regulator [unclassified Leisingera]MBQ4825154.1 winged helix-turn-helix transcriptional regulator [Leisingera sp. HS039]MCF6431443.1 MarR family winged helix-turn-helix transcriptional regulator [Leisingera sp. MMG026]QAX31891.1 MarR family transcriptional regulator [Leisingera sp. NJS204]QBR38683.1 MarR family transcriptional regulator [Leisingera sp. NJS201]
MTPSKRETEIWILLNRACRQTHRDIETELREAGLPGMRWYDVLWGIELAGDGGVRAFELTRNLLFEQSNLSRILAQMAKQGLVREAVYEHDRRGKVLHLTAAGAALRLRMWGIYGPAIKRSMAALAEAEDVQSFLTILQETGGGPFP